MIKLTDEAILQARQWFANNCLETAKEARDSIITGVWYCNDPDLVAEQHEARALQFLNTNDFNHSFTFRQRAYYFQTGKSFALLP